MTIGPDEVSLTEPHKRRWLNVLTGKINIHLYSICTIRCGGFPSLRNLSTDVPSGAYTVLFVLTSWVLIYRRQRGRPVLKTMIGISLVMFILATMVSSIAYVSCQISLRLALAHQCQFYANNTGIYNLQKRTRRTISLLQPALQLYSTFRKHDIRRPDSGWRWCCGMLILYLPSTSDSDQVIVVALSVLSRLGQEICHHCLSLSAICG
jgi:hypothetical protein